jgi:hypothetical protein
MYIDVLAAAQSKYLKKLILADSTANSNKAILGSECGST